MFSAMLRTLAWSTATLSLLTTVLAVAFGHQSAGAAPLHFTIPYPEAIKGDSPVAAAAGPVKWHKSFEAAKATSLKTGKPILLFHMGQTDRKVCGAPPVGAMLFASLEVADYINANYEPVWESGRQAAISLVDFGGTANWAYAGSTATYVCGPDGVVYDLVVGTHPPEVYRKQLEEIKKFTDSLRTLTATREAPTEIERQRVALARDTRLREYHRRRQAELFEPTAGQALTQQSPFGGKGLRAFGFCPDFPNFCGAFNCCASSTSCNGFVGHLGNHNFGGFGSYFGGPRNFGSSFGGIQPPLLGIGNTSSK